VIIAGVGAIELCTNVPTLLCPVADSPSAGIRSLHIAMRWPDDRIATRPWLVARKTTIRN